MHLYNQTPFTVNHPPLAEIADFNAALTKLFGQHFPSGRPWVRLVWMPSEEQDEYGEPLTFDWNEYGDGGRGNYRRRYLYSASCRYLESYDPELGIWYAKEIWDDIAPPRFGLERLVPPETACAGWTPKGVDSDGAKWTARPKPIHGYYEPLNIARRLSPLLWGGMLASHDDHCCAAAKAEGVDCYGAYVEPSREHLAELERLAYAKRHEREERPGQMTAAQFAASRARNRARNEQAFAAIAKTQSQIVTENMRIHRAAYNEDPSVKANGVYHWVSGTGKSGLPSKFKITSSYPKESTNGTSSSE